MTRTAIVEFRIRAERLEDAKPVFAAMLQTTREFEGFVRLDWLVDRDDPTLWVLYEQWATWDAEQAYRDFRASPAGAVPGLAGLVQGPPRLVRLEPVAG
jgi:quinol monooxygenase YgiN